MSVRRPQRDCPLCAWTLEAETHAAVYHAYQEHWREENCYTQVAKKAAKLGVAVSEEEARKHFQYHRIIQPAPKTRFRVERALEQGKALPLRLQEILTLVSRVPALSGTQLAELFYWTGHDHQTASARNACYRDLRRLVLDNFLYRWYPQVASGPSGSAQRAAQLRNAFYLLGRDAVPLVNMLEGYEPVRGQAWVLNETDLPSERKLFELNAAAGTITALARKAKQLESARQGVPVSGNTAYLRFVPMNWFGGSRLAVELGASGRFTPGGLASFGIHLPLQTQRVSVGCPFLYEHDDGVDSAEKLAEHLLRYVDLKRAGKLAERLPQLQTLFPPVIVTMRDAHRSEQVRQLLQAQARKRGASVELPIIVICDQATVDTQSLDAPIWASAWDTAVEPERRSLVDVLLRNWKVALDLGLTATMRLEYRPAKSAARAGQGE